VLIASVTRTFAARLSVPRAPGFLATRPR
jgi:hypothetical protein